MVSLNQKIFDIIKSCPYTDRPNIHRTMLIADADYVVVCGNAAIARLLRAKYIRRDMNDRFVAHVDTYTPLPPFIKDKKKKVKAKVNPAMNAYQHVYTPPLHTPQISAKPKKSFFTKLRELFSD
jgi:hypothetical protein